jgi:hypothetical protein
MSAHAGVQGTIKVDSGEYVSGDLSAPSAGEQWRIYLQRNKFYAIYGLGNEGVEVEVHASGGKLLYSFVSKQDNENYAGVSFKAPYTGYYTVVAIAPPLCSPSIGFPCVDSHPVKYKLAASRDCAGSTSTRCAISVGGTLDRLKLSYAVGGIPPSYSGDHDWFRSSLKSGKSYTLSMSNTTLGHGCIAIFLRDSAGTMIKSADCANNGEILSFTAQYTGKYYIDVCPCDDRTTPETYSLSLREN